MVCVCFCRSSSVNVSVILFWLPGFLSSVSANLEWRIRMATLPKTSSSPLKIAFPKGKSSEPTIHFQVRTVGFREGSHPDFTSNLHLPKIIFIHDLDSIPIPYTNVKKIAARIVFFKRKKRPFGSLSNRWNTEVRQTTFHLWICRLNRSDSRRYGRAWCGSDTWLLRMFS